MKSVALVLFVLALAAFVAAAFLGATPAAARLTNIGLALLTCAFVAQGLPLP